MGNLLAAAAYGLVFPHLHGKGMFTPWRVMFMIGALPALLAFLPAAVCEGIRRRGWNRGRRDGQGQVRVRRLTSGALMKFLPAFLFIVVLMTAFTAFSHGTQDLYPTFLERDQALSPSRVGICPGSREPWGTVRRDLFRDAVGEVRAAEGHSVRSAAFDSYGAVVGVVALGGDARGRWVPAAVHGAGSVGRDSGAPERAISRRRSGRFFRGWRTSLGTCCPRETASFRRLMRMRFRAEC